MKNKNELKILTEKKIDIWKPKDFDKYEYYLYNQKEFIIKQNKISNYPLINYKDISLRNKQSNIFCFKQERFKNIKPEYRKIKLLDNDIFNLQSVKNKCSKLLLQKEKYNRYTSQNPSNSSWIDIYKKPNLLNYASTDWNILNSSTKSMFLTKDKIISECKKKGYKPTFKSKSISEFKDLVRPSASHINIDFVNAIKNNKNCVKKSNEIGSYFDAYIRGYKSIIDRPFSSSGSTKNIFKIIK